MFSTSHKIGRARLGQTPAGLRIVIPVYGDNFLGRKAEQKTDAEARSFSRPD